MAVKSLQVLYLGSEYLDKRHLVYGMVEEEWIDTVFLSFIIRTDDGNVLVDTGCHPADAEERNAMGAKMKLQPGDHLPQRLKEAGLSMEDINMVVMTHLDFDHVGWLSYLKHAEVVLQKEEHEFAFDPPPYARHRFRHPERFNSPDIKWRLVDGDCILMPGLTLLFTPGHTPGHQSVMLDLPESGTILLVGDAGHFQENFEKELIPSFCGDPRQALYSIRRLKVWSQVRNAPIFPTHDMNFWRQEMKKPPDAYL